MRYLLKMLLFPFMLVMMFVMLFEAVLSRLPFPLRVLVRVSFVPLYLVGMLGLLYPDDDDPTSPLVTPMHAGDLCFERHGWTRTGHIGNRYVLESGGTILFRPANPETLEPELQRALEKGFTLPNGVRWGGVRMVPFGGTSRLTVLYVAQDGDQCFTATFEGTAEEEACADAFFASARRQDEAPEHEYKTAPTSVP